MNILDAIKSEIRETDRREWSGEIGGTGVTLYARPLTPSDHEAVAKKGYANFAMHLQPGAMCEFIALKAEDEGGEKVFKPNRDVPVLMRLDSRIITEIFFGLFSRTDIEPETEDEFGERVGNSEATTND